MRPKVGIQNVVVGGRFGLATWNSSYTGIGPFPAKRRSESLCAGLDIAHGKRAQHLTSAIRYSSSRGERQAWRRTELADEVWLWV